MPESSVFLFCCNLVIMMCFGEYRTGFSLCNCLATGTDDNVLLSRFKLSELLTLNFKYTSTVSAERLVTLCERTVTRCKTHLATEADNYISIDRWICVGR